MVFIFLKKTNFILVIYVLNDVFCLFQVYFHSPSDVPDYSHSSLKLSKSSHSFVQIVTHLSLTDDGLKSWTPEERGCYYLNEKWLRHNSVYSYINCYVECQVNYTETLCGCAPMYRISKIK